MSKDVAIGSAEPTLEIHSGITLKGELSMLRDVTLTGQFEGDLRTLGRLTVSAGGSVVGSIEAGALNLEPGNKVEARIKISTSPKPKPNTAPEGKPSDSKWPLSLKKLKEFALGRA